MFKATEFLIIGWSYFIAFLPESLPAAQPHLFKCSAQVYQNRMRIPQSLRAPISEKAENYWRKLFGSDLYRFNLRDHGFNCNSKAVEVYDLGRRSNYKRRMLGIQNQYILNDFYWTPEGTLKTTRHNTLEWNTPKHYCISTITHEYIQVQTCVPKCGSRDVCLPKCCAASQVLSFNYTQPKPFACTEVAAPEWQPSIYKFRQGARSIYPKSEKNKSIHFTHSIVPCRPFQIISPDKPVQKMHLYNQGIIRILEGGEVMTRKNSNQHWRQIKTGFCLDRIWDMEAATEFESSEQTVAIVHCEKPPPTNFTPSKIYLPVFILSSIFALLTVMVYCLLWSKQNIHGWTIAAFSFCMFFNLVTSAFAYGVGLFQKNDLILPGSTTCVIVGVINQFFDIAMFSWLTVICFDLWTTLSSMAPASSRSKGYKKFMGYASFGFGIPTAVVLVSIAIELKYKNSEDTLVYKPLYGQDVCSVDKISTMYYVTLVNMVLYVVNLIFAGLVVKTLYNFKHGTKQATNASSQKSRGRYSLYLKLFVIMGITWIFEFIAWFAAGETVKWYWSVIDVYNILHAVAIFWIFVCKVEIKDQLLEKYNTFKQTFGTRGKNAYRLHRRGSHSSDTDTKSDH